MKTAPQYLSCARVRVAVQSIRWPEQRVSVGGAGASASCIKVCSQLVCIPSLQPSNSATHDA